MFLFEKIKKCISFFKHTKNNKNIYEGDGMEGFLGLFPLG